MMKSCLLLAIVALFSFASTSSLHAHCQVPCGIYSDDTVLIDLQDPSADHRQGHGPDQRALCKDAGKNANQLSRWVTNKEEHATKIQDTMTQYFLAQRVKLAESESNKDAYLNKLSLIHQIIVHAMKCKQTTDPANAQGLHDAIAAFTKAYTAK